ncbi:MAG: ABC transporter substrate-binding protein [Gemmatimonadota bacterium]|nr:ABC transporter substrate-binding protein [Gemmatimonadota bacterium]
MTRLPQRIHAFLRASSVCLTLIACARDVTPGRGNTLVAAITSDPGHLNPAITTNGGVHTAADLLYDGLISLGDDLKPRPALAARWTVEDGGARYRFILRSGVTWHDGQPFTSADVKFSFDSVLLRFHSRTRASLLPVLLRIDAPDDTTVVFQFKRPYAPLLAQLDVVEAPIIPKHLYAGTDPLKNPRNMAPVGTGPFRFISYAHGTEIRYAKNANYFSVAPTLDGVVMRVIPDASTQVAALEAGEVDWLFGVPGPDRARLRTSPHIRLEQSSVSPGGSNCVSTVGFNLDRPVFHDLRVRQAVAYALDRPQFVERVTFGEGRLADAPISSAIAFAHADHLAMPAFDTLRADSLLTAAGWQRASASGVREAHGVKAVKDGTPLALTFKAMTSMAPYGELLRAQLKRVGLDLTVVALEPVVFAQSVFTARDFDMSIAPYCQGSDPQIGVQRMYTTASIAPVPFSNMAGYRNAVMDSLFQRAGSALDVEERRRFYRQIQELAVRDQPYVWLVETTNTHAYNTRCHGFGVAAHFAATATCTP